MQDILSRTVQLFRPYFSWRVKVADMEDAVNIGGDDKELRKQQQLQHPTPPSTFRAENHSEDPSPGSSISSLTCAKHCPFYGSLSGGGSCASGREYVFTVLHSSSCGEEEDDHHPPAPSHASLLPCPPLQLCLDHSLFAVLVRGLVSPEAVVQMVEILQGKSPSLGSLKLLCTFCAMSECSCLLWAR